MTPQAALWMHRVTDVASCQICVQVVYGVVLLSVFLQVCWSTSILMIKNKVDTNNSLVITNLVYDASVSLVFHCIETTQYGFLIKSFIGVGMGSFMRVLSQDTLWSSWTIHLIGTIIIFIGWVFSFCLTLPEVTYRIIWLVGGEVSQIVRCDASDGFHVISTQTVLTFFELLDSSFRFIIFLSQFFIRFVFETRA